MRRLLLSAALVAAAASTVGTTPASAARECVFGTVGVCYELFEGCPHTCTLHVIVDGRCIDFIGAVCEVVDPLYIDSVEILPAA